MGGGLRAWLWQVIARQLARPAVADWLIRRAQWRPYWHLDGYMERYWLLGGSHPMRDHRSDAERGWKRSRLDAFIGRFVAIRIHHILRADNERHLHDHPFDFRSVILRGTYREQDIVGVHRACREGTTYAARAERFHRIAWVTPGGVWSCFLMGPKRQEWGFLVGGRKVLHYDYHAAIAAERGEAEAGG